MRVTTLAPRVPAGAARLGSLPASRRLTITIALRPSHTDRLAALLRDLYDPSSARYQQWLRPGEFTREFGPSPQQIDAVTSWLHGQGLVDTSVQGMAVHATGTPRAVAHALGVSFSQYRLGGTSTGYVASAAPLVPRAVAGDITSIVGLSDTVRLHNSLHVAPRTGTGIGTRGTRSGSAGAAKVATATGCVATRSFAGDKFWTPAQISSLYGVNNLFTAGLTGKGKSIALVEFAPSVAADTNSFLSCFALHNKVTVVPVNGGSPTDPQGTIEAEVDIQEAATQAPGTSILSYEAPNTGAGEYDLYNAIVTQDRAQVVSTSWGDCESDVASAGTFINAMETVFQQAAAQGQSVFAASGDTGSEGCYDGTSNPTSVSLDVDHPASDPFVTGVGGTSFVKPGSEPVWNDCEGEIGAVVRAERRERGRQRPLDPLQASGVAAARVERHLHDLPRSAGYLRQRGRVRDLLRRGLDRGGRHEHRVAEAGRYRRRHRGGLEGREPRRFRTQARRARGRARVRDRAQRREDRDQLDEPRRRGSGQHRPHPQPRRRIPDYSRVRRRDRLRNAARGGLGVPAGLHDDTEPGQGRSRA